jgi:predicted PurR-regulated permease PerM
MVETRPIPMMTNNKYTFDNVIRGILWAIIITGIVMLLNRLSSVLVPFFLAWLIAYLLFPLVKFFQYRCKMKYRILGILSAFLVTGLVLTGVFMLMIPPMVEESFRVKDLLLEPTRPSAIFQVWYISMCANISVWRKSRQ